MRSLKFAGVLFLLGTIANLNAQTVDDLRINEVMLINTENYVDNFGQRSAWIEIMNTAYSSVDIENCYLTDDLNNLKKYRIKSGDPASKLSTRHFVILFANGYSERGVMHLNFALDSTNRFVALVSSNGKTIIDSVTVPPLGPNQVYSRTVDGIGAWEITDSSTPGTTNHEQLDEISPSEAFGAFDPSGIIMSVIAMSVVFISLIILYRIFRGIGNLSQWNARRKSKKSVHGVQVKEEVPGEVYAAIATALHLYESDKHDYESTIITIERVSKRYSPWSSKIYGLREMPPRMAGHRSRK